jgi:hypothetical protein
LWLRKSIDPLKRSSYNPKQNPPRDYDKLTTCTTAESSIMINIESGALVHQSK